MDYGTENIIQPMKDVFQVEETAQYLQDVVDSDQSGVLGTMADLANVGQYQPVGNSTANDAVLGLYVHEVAPSGSHGY